MRQLKEELRNLLKDYTSAATHTTTLYLTIKVITNHVTNHFKMAISRPLFCLFSFFHTMYWIKTVDCSSIQTQIIRDHLPLPQFILTYLINSLQLEFCKHFLNLITEFKIYT